MRVLNSIPELYADFISWYDPYYMDDNPENIADMIYNLKEIKKDLQSLDDGFPDVQEALTKIDSILQLA